MKSCDILFNIFLLILHQWKSPEDTLIMVGPRAKTLNGSLISSSLGIIGNKLEGMEVNEGVREYVDRLSVLIKSRMVKSSVPINRGGPILRVFEGIIASCMGAYITMDPAEMFPESFGAAILEIPTEFVGKILREYHDLTPTIVGKIVPQQELIVAGKKLDLHRIYEPWNTKFEQEVVLCQNA